MSDAPPPTPLDRPDLRGNAPDLGAYKSLAPDLRSVISDQRAKDVAPARKEVAELTQEQRQALVGRVDGPLDVSKTPGHIFLQELEKGLKNWDPHALETAKAISDVLYEKRSDGTSDTYRYSMNPHKLEDLRLGLQMVKPDADKLAALVSPKDRPLYMGEGGRVGSAARIDAAVGTERILTVLDARSTLGQAFALEVLLRGGSTEQIKAVSDQGTALQSSWGGLTGINAARERNAAAGRAATADFNSRNGAAAEVRSANSTGAKTPESNSAGKIMESRNAAASAFGKPLLEGQRGTYKDPFDGRLSYVASSRREGSAANSAERAAIAENEVYKKQLYEERKVGIQQPGRVNAGGPDFILFNRSSEKIEIWDVKARGPGGGEPSQLSPTDVLQKWGNEVNQAINGWIDKNGQHMGGVETGNVALDQQIKAAWANGRVDVIQPPVVRLPDLPKHAEKKLGPL